MHRQSLHRRSLHRPSMLSPSFNEGGGSGIAIAPSRMFSVAFSSPIVSVALSLFTLCINPLRAHSYDWAAPALSIVKAL